MSARHRRSRQPSRDCLSGPLTVLAMLGLAPPTAIVGPELARAALVGVERPDLPPMEDDLDASVSHTDRYGTRPPLPTP